MKGYTRGGNKRREGGTMPSQGFSKLCYKRAFDSGEGMGRGWEWVVKTLGPTARDVCRLCA